MKQIILLPIAILLFAGSAFGQTAAHPPMPRNQARWLSGASDLYPATAMRIGAQGRVDYTLTIDPNGRVGNCRVTTSSGNADLDQATCNIMRRYARFDPAVDDAGKPVSGEWSSAWKWILPR